MFRQDESTQLNSDPKALQIIVIGAGFAGLAAATRLAEAGIIPIVVEATARGGGRARSFVDRASGREIDNGQHLLMGCYHQTRQFLKRIGQREALAMQPKLRVRMCEEHNNLDLRCPPLPAPLNLAAGLLRMRGLSLLQRAQALRVGLALQNKSHHPDDYENCDQWLNRLGQGPALRRSFWDPLIWATLNDDPLQCSAAMLSAVLQRAFLGSAQDSCFAWAKVPLNPFYVEPSLRYLEQKGAQLYMSQRVRALELQEQRVQGIRLKNGPRLMADAVICAVPPHALHSMWPADCAPEFAQRLAAFEYAPIVNHWAFFDPKSSNVPARIQPFAGLINSPLHWLFDRDALEQVEQSRVRARIFRRPSPTQGNTETPSPLHGLLNITISGAHGFQCRDSAKEQQFLEAELGRFWPPHSARPKISRLLTIQEKRATIRHKPGSYNNRPKAQSPIQGLWLAGDWTATGLPATIESAVQSGHEAADQLLASIPLLNRKNAGNGEVR